MSDYSAKGIFLTRGETQEQLLQRDMIVSTGVSIHLKIRHLELLKEVGAGVVPGSPVAKTPCSQSKGLGFEPWSGN